jgi:TP901 family phage tail tape measure protein
MAGLSDITLFIRAKTDAFQKGLQNAEKKLVKSGKKMQSAGETLSSNLSVPLAAAGGAALKAASDFEDSMVEIQKVTDQTTADKLRGSVRSLAEEIPVSQDKLAGLTAETARFGVEGPKNIEKFTKVVAKLGTATSLSMDTAGENIAKLQTVTGTSTDEVSNLGSALNSLEANSATSAQEVTDNVLKASKGLRSLGANNKEMLALAAATNEVNSDAKNAGTQLNNLANNLLDPDKAAEVADVLGMTSKEFTRMRDNSPIKTLKTLAGALKEGGAKGEQLRGTLNQTALKAVSSLSGNMDGLNKALRVSSKEYERNKSLNEQSAAAFSTFSSKVQITFNKLRNMAITIGEKLMPVARSLLDFIGGLADKFNALSSSTQKNVIAFGGLAGALGPLLTVTGALSSKIAGPLLGSFGRFLKKALKIGPAILKIATPMGLLKTVAVAAAGLLIANWDKVSKFFEGLGLVSIFKTVASGIKTAIETVVGLFLMLSNKVGDALSGSEGNLKGFGNFVRQVLSAVFDAFKTAFDNVLTIVATVINNVGYYFNALKKLFEGDFTGALNSLQKVFKSSFLAILDIVGNVVTFILDKLAGLASYLPGSLGDTLKDGLESAKESVKSGKEAIVDALDLQKVREDQEKTKKSIKSFFKTASKLGELPSMGSLLGGGGSGGGSDEGKDKEKDPLKKLPKKTQGGGGTGEGPEAAPVIAQKKLNKQLDKTAKKIPTVTKRQKQLATINTQTINKAGDAIAKSLDKATQGLSASFSALIMGQKSASQAFSNFGKTVGNIFKQLIQQLIQMVIKMLAIKAITAAITGGGSLLSGGGSLISGLGSSLSSGIGSLLGGGGPGGLLGAGAAGGGGGREQGQTIEVKQRGDELRNTLNFNNKRNNRKGTGG